MKWRLLDGDFVARTGPALRCTTWSREIRPFNALIHSLTFDGSVLSFTLKRTTCSMVWDDDMFVVDDDDDDSGFGVCLGVEKVRENEVEKSSVCVCERFQIGRAHV